MNPIDFGAGTPESRRNCAPAGHAPSPGHTPHPVEDGSSPTLSEMSDGQPHDWQHAWIDLGGEG